MDVQGTPSMIDVEFKCLKCISKRCMEGIADQHGLKLEIPHGSKTEPHLFVWVVWIGRDEFNTGNKKIILEFPIWENLRWGETRVLLDFFSNHEVRAINLYQRDCETASEKWHYGIGLTFKEHLPKQMQNFLSAVGL